MSALPQAPAQAGVTAILAALGGGRARESGPGFEQLFAGLPAERSLDAAAPLSAVAPKPALPSSADLPIDPAIAMAQTVKTPALDAATLAGPVDDLPSPNAVPVEGQPAPGATAAATLLAVLDGSFAAAKPAAILSGTKAAAAPKPASAIDSPKGEVESEDTPAALDAADRPVDATALSPLLGAILSPDAKPTAPAATAGDKPAPAPTAVRTAEPASPLAVDPKGAKSIVPDASASMTVLFAQPATHGAAAVAEAARAAPVAERVLDMGSDDAWIAQLASDIAATKSDSGDISFRLMPRHLGRLDVAMTNDEAGVSVKLDTQHEATATVVHAAQGKLVEELRQQGVRVAGAEVTCTPGETGRQSQGQGRAPAEDPAHLIETAAERAQPRSEPHREDSAVARRGRFA
ncbi:flagellar hook-length control protein FliK [Sphingopyxis sp. GW247-27LB]|uniref:flagellar hook-length control protein FliK n=1 Tax=Sphingopyxis sp. GW247-27LB TaxID=2012632 RepID=UPI001C3EBF4A|nr:flagellar hook-length control protein FliK [Sphingopyxis sp. GW247-27LB]